MNSSTSQNEPSDASSADASTTEPSPSRQDRLQAEAREEVRRRVRQRELRAEADATLNRTTRARRAPWEWAPDSTTGWWFDLFGPRLLLWLGLSALWLVISSLFWLFTNLRLPIYLTVRALDIATGAHALRAAPWLMWTLWGAIFGASLGYWLVAPLYGNRENRSFMLLLPLLAMVITGGLLWAFVP